MLFALACEQATEPELGPQGTVTLHFASAATSMVASDGVQSLASAPPDTVIVHVFRPGTPITQEVQRLVDLSGATDVSIPCIAENGKRVSVDLYTGGQFTHHGFTTGVNVVKGEHTAVSIDAYDFTIASLNVKPSPLATEPEPFDLTWSPAAAATSYDVQASATADFSTIQWQQSVTDTLITDVNLAPGGHYFRVVPRTPFAHGPSCPEQFAYLRSAPGVVITGFSVPAAKPNDVITIYGENFDYPGTQAWIGSRQMTILSSSWGSMDVRIPRAAVSEGISVANAIGLDTEPYVVQRVAYVTNVGTYAPGYLTALEKHNDDFGYSGVAELSVDDLDTQDMTVFDIIIVAQDTGTSLANWGGGVPTRANAIANTAANVLAMGRGGAVFLQLVGATSAPQTTANDSDTDYYVPVGSDQIFSTPHAVGGGFVTWDAQKKPSTTSFNFTSAPAGVNLYASTDCSRVVFCTGPNDQWVLSDFRFNNPGGTPVVYFHWGYNDKPDDLTSAATDCLGNIMSMLYRTRVLTTTE